MRSPWTRILAVTVIVALTLTACSQATPSGPAPAASPRPSATPSPTPSQQEKTLSDEEQARLDARLRASAWDDDVAAAGELIERGADVNAKDDTQQSAFLIATSEGYRDLLDLTLRHDADVDALDSFRGTGVIRAAERGHAGVVGRLLEHGVDPDHVNRLGWVALHEALVFAKPEQRREYVETTRVLVASGADVTIRSERDGQTPAQLARTHGLDAQLRLIERAADTRPAAPEDADRRLLRAAGDGDADEAALALRQGARLETRNDRDQTPLLVAAAADHLAVARLLVHLGGDPDALDARHDTPWLVTGVTGSVAMGRVILAAGPDLRIENRFGGLSPIPAGERGHADYVRWVSETDVDLDHVNDLGWTALLEAVVLGDGSRPYQDIVSTLVDAGADRSITDRQGRTALDHARAEGFDEIVARLSSDR
ncbi:ankyrin repeat domain-containing protein [Aeromicrobium sp. CF4.19]|uniref:ankyrin repeat domain-containing protein n=1 Tax=Aeromicrobium sp. CF4.19 TaxID=3373082 RepID=UPI003EE68C27